MAATTATRTTSFQMGSAFQSEWKMAMISPNDHVQTSSRNLKIATIPCCRNCMIALMICSTTLPPKCPRARPPGRLQTHTRPG